MSPETSGQEGTAFAHSMIANDPASAAAGIRVVRYAPGAAVATMTVTADMVNGHAITHGGYVFLLADTAFAVAANGYGRPTVASAGAITFVAPTRLGDELVAEAVERIRRGRTGVYDVTVRCAGEVIAEFRGNSRELPPPNRVSQP